MEVKARSRCAWNWDSGEGWKNKKTEKSNTCVSESRGMNENYECVSKIYGVLCMFTLSIRINWTSRWLVNVRATGRCVTRGMRLPVGAKLGPIWNITYSLLIKFAFTRAKRCHGTPRDRTLFLSLMRFSWFNLMSWCFFERLASRLAVFKLLYR